MKGNTTSGFLSSNPDCLFDGAEVPSFVEPKAPPTGNTGARTALVDWLSFTAGDDIAVSTVKTFLPGLDFVEMERAGRGYKRACKCGHVTIYYDGMPGMGTHVEISAQGCRELEGMGVVKHWQLFASTLVTAGFKCTRLDMANDDREGIISLDEIRRAIDERRVVTRFDHWDDMQSGALKKKGPQGRTIYFGSSMSETRIRFYDKAAEQYIPAAASARSTAAAAPSSQVESPSENVDHWIRCEMQFRGKRADQALKLLAGASGMDLVARILGALLEFKEIGKHSQRERWPVCKWWSDFLVYVGKMKLGTQPLIRTVETAFIWVQKQVAPTLAMLVEASGGDLEQITRLIVEGGTRLRTWHRAALAALAGPQGVAS